MIWRTLKTMNVIGIAAISLFCGLFLALLLAGLGVLLWLAVRLRRENAAMSKQIQELIAGHQAEMKSSIDSAKASFAGIRSEMKTILDGHSKNTKTMLEEHRRQMQAGIDKINAEALIGAAARAIQACQRLETAVSVIQRMFMDVDSKPTHEYGPEETAPEDTKFGGPPSAFSVARTPAMDEETEREAVAENQPELFATQE